MFGNAIIDVLRIKQRVCLWRLDVLLGKHSGLQSSAAWGYVFTGDSSTSLGLFKIPGDLLHTVCMATVLSFLFFFFSFGHQKKIKKTPFYLSGIKRLYLICFSKQVVSCSRENFKAT